MTDRQYPIGRFAVVRGVPCTYGHCIRPSNSLEPIDVDRARRQHMAYCNALLGLGLKLIEIEPNDMFPDCCFVEDTAIIAGGLAIIAKPGVGSRVGEEVAVRDRLREYMSTVELENPARVDGGDVLVIDKSVYIGLGGRSNKAAVDQIRKLLLPMGFKVFPLLAQGVLHLKSVLTYLGDGCVVMLSGHLMGGVFNEYVVIEVPEEEAYAANCLSVNGKVLMSVGFPRTREKIEACGFETIELEMSEFRKGQGSLTCLSKIF